MSEATTPGRKGNLAGSARKLKDNAADWHNFIQKWERLNDEGAAIATSIVNLGLSKKSADEPNVVMEGDSSQTGSLSEISLKQSNQELEEECNKLQDVVEKMMQKMVLAERGICALEAFQYGEKGNPAPLFHTWSTQQFAEVSSKLYASYKQELALKQTILQELAHTVNTDLTMVYLSSWQYQPYIEESGKLLLESLLLETGHRSL
ncbi:cyclin-dependent kinase 2-interacting protein-like isoform X2 [Xyrauchen texanus]|uniref:cyclin-dependent kinase 2-interacting protein-like isoform X2 n=1 Tax=Xyrauchen texanus TaxID=154827 RepID=UPI002241A527|nr:cyclin-dependent kinase 2-interacting protein-like isoform X2 [Xyrauchen texanus]